MWATFMEMIVFFTEKSKGITVTLTPSQHYFISKLKKS